MPNADHQRTRLRQWQLSRRRMLRGAALSSAGLVGAVVIGCAERGRPAPAPVVKQPKRGGAIVRAGGPGPATFDTQGSPFDPHISQTNATKGHRLIYEALLGYDLVTLEAQPELARSWEQPSQTEYIFTLAPGVKWQDKPPVNGRALRTEDVVFSLERVRTNDPRFLYRSLLAQVDQITAMDSARIRVTTRKPTASLLALLGADPMLVLAPEVVERARSFLSPEEVVGTGAFLLKSAQEGVAGEYVRNPGYWKPGRPYLDGVRTPHFPDDQSGYAAFLAKTVDITLVPGIEVKKYLAGQDPASTPLWYKQDTYVQAIANTQAKPTDDARVTRALRLLLDHQEFITAWSEVQVGRGQYGSIFPTALDSWDLPQEEYQRHIFWKQPKDEAIREALDLLSAAGFTAANPLPLELLVSSIPGIKAAGELVDAQWRRLGRGVVQGRIRLLDQITATTDAVRGAFTFAVIGNAAALPEPTIYLNQIWRTGGSRNYSRFSDPRVDDMIDRQDATFDPQQRKEMVKEIVRYMMDRSPAVVPANQFRLNAVRPQVQGFAPEFYMNGRQYQWIWLET